MEAEVERPLPIAFGDRTPKHCTTFLIGRYVRKVGERKDPYNEADVGLPGVGWQLHGGELMARLRR